MLLEGMNLGESFILPINFYRSKQYHFWSLEDEFLINEDPDGIPITNGVLTNCLIKTKNTGLAINKKHSE
jgi:hypothetical protein